MAAGAVLIRREGQSPLAVVTGVQQDQQPAAGQVVQPGEAILVVGLFVVAQHADGRDAGVAQALQFVGRLEQRLGRDGALVEQVAGDDDEIDALGQRVLHGFVERVVKVIVARVGAVLGVAQVNVCDVQEPDSHASSLLRPLS